MSQAETGDFVGIHFKNIPAKHIRRGYVVGKAEDASFIFHSKGAAELTVQIVLVYNQDVHVNYCPLVFCKNFCTECVVTKLISKVDRK